MTVALCNGVKNPYIKKAHCRSLLHGCLLWHALSCPFGNGVMFLPVRGSNGGSLSFSTFLHISLSQFAEMSHTSLCLIIVRPPHDQVIA